MAVREISIPFGPDKTGGLGYGILADEARIEEDDAQAGAKQASESEHSEQLVDPFANHTGHSELPSFASYDFDDESVEPVSVGKRPLLAEDANDDEHLVSPRPMPASAETVVLPPVEMLPVEQRAADSLGEEQSEASEQPVQLEPIQGMPAARKRVAPAQKQPQPHEDFDDEPARGGNDVQTSFAALRDSMGQSRELKAREKELEEFRVQLELETEELADREEILANYDAMISEQDRIIAESTAARDDYKSELAQVMDDTEQITEELEEMRASNDDDLEPLQSELGRARAVADQAKNDERSRKSELNAAEAEVRRAGTGQDAVMAQARYDSVRLAHEKAAAASERAQGMLDEVQRAYDDAIAQIEQMETPLKHALDDLAQSEEELKDLIAQLGEDISAAKKRRQYCESVHLYPEETAKLRKAVAADEKELYEMKLDYDELNSLLQENKSRALKAKLALGAGIVIVIVFVVVLAVLFLRG